MTLEEIKLRRLAEQYLLNLTDTNTVVKDLCGAQAQFLSHALHGLSIRCGSVNTSALIKGWTNRGTMHLFVEEDLPLFLYEGRTHFLRDVDKLGSDAFITASQKAYFANVVLDAIASGVEDRDALKAICADKGMTDSESKSLFDPWGGLIRALCESGRICHKVQEKKAYRICPDVEPMDQSSAQLELLRRYFTHFGPATVKDAAYFFGWTQAQIKKYLPLLPLSQFHDAAKTYYYTDAIPLPNADAPDCLFLAGFDQLVLGYEKTESIFLSPEHLRQIFTLSGIVRPALLIDGEIKGHWNLKNRKLKIALFEGTNRQRITAAAELQWPDLKEIIFE